MKQQEIFIPKHWIPFLETYLSESDQASYDANALQKYLADFLSKNRFLLARSKSINNSFYVVYDIKNHGIWCLAEKFKNIISSEVFHATGELSSGNNKNWIVPQLELLHGLFVDSTSISSFTEALTHAQPDGNGLFFTFDEEKNSINAFNPQQPRTKILLELAQTAQLLPFLKCSLETFIEDFILSELYETKYEDTWLPSQMWEMLFLSEAGNQAFRKFVSEIDHIQMRFNELENAWFEDTNKGIWELHWASPPENLDQYYKIKLSQPIEVRDPALDVIKSAKVGIDFGTSSTVVAVRKDGRTELLRIGIADLLKAAEPKDYQNPTLIEFKNYQELEAKWKSETYRPLLKWGEELRLSHEALSTLNDNLDNAKVVSSVLSRLKQFPLGENKNVVVRLVDQQGKEFHIPKMTCRDLVKGEYFNVNPEDEFDPIELYAYYLGLFINNRHKGIYLRYYMTFPVGYAKEVRRTILASFKRGLLRSMPASLLADPIINDFRVEEVGTEPVAYAAAALDILKNENVIVLPEDCKPIYYAIFDFGGGTTDFDFGEYRLSEEEEYEEEGCEEVLKHYGASGDKFLGGENLIEHLAYHVFQLNHEVCREHHIQFTCPLDGEPFAGSEMLINDSWIAKANTTVLMSHLRALWVEYEKDSLDNLKDDSLQEVLFNKDGERLPPIELVVPVLKLKEVLASRVYTGIKAFFSAMKEAFVKQKIYPEEVQILLAGNASKSILVQDIFHIIQKQLRLQRDPKDPNVEMERLKRELAIARGEYIPTEESVDQVSKFEKFVKIEEITQIFSGLDTAWLPDLRIHLPLADDPAQLSRATGKTGVAIGALKLVPGETLKVEEPQGEDEAPFQFFIGRYVRSVFKPIINRNDPYQVWHELGKPIKNAFVLVYTQDVRVTTEEVKRGENAHLREFALEFEGDIADKRLFVCAKHTNTVELVLADSLEEAQEGGFSCTQYREVTLTL